MFMDNTSQYKPCIICSCQAVEKRNQSYTIMIECPRCGKFYIDENLHEDWNDYELTDSEKSLLSHKIRLASKHKKAKYILTNDILENLKNQKKITPAEQINNFVIFLGNTQETPGQHYFFRDTTDNSSKELFASIGMSIKKEAENFSWILHSLKAENLIELISSGIQDISLTFKGWERFEELNSSPQNTKKAFMAFQFPRPENNKLKDLDDSFALIYQKLKIGAKEAGFDLGNPLLEESKAGSITNRLAVEIRQSRFLVADLSHGNQGAYWEAGFAHGLGKHVFYTCKKDKEDEIKPHFDISQHSIIFWDEKEPEKAGNDLKYAILNTLV